MRWQDPETGMVPPAQFIPLMEQTGLILDAGRWALGQVARDCQTCSLIAIRCRATFSVARYRRNRCRNCSVTRIKQHT